MNRVRKAILMGQWYPSSASETKASLDAFAGQLAPTTYQPNIGGMAPHAGWMFSGKLAYQVFSAFKKSNPDVLVVFGGHLPADYPPILITNTAWQTPFGELTLHEEINKKIQDTYHVQKDTGSLTDNTIEIQLPMLHYIFNEIPLVAVHLPNSESAADAALAIHQVIKGENLNPLYFASNDLTHYGPDYGFSPKGTGSAAVTWVKEVHDKAFLDKALAMDIPGVIELGKQRASCSAGTVAGLIAIAKEEEISNGKVLDYYTSYDVHPRDSFVGYAGLVF